MAITMQMTAIKCGIIIDIAIIDPSILARNVSIILKQEGSYLSTAYQSVLVLLIILPTEVLSNQLIGANNNFLISAI